MANGKRSNSGFLTSAFLAILFAFTFIPGRAMEASPADSVDLRDVATRAGMSFAWITRGEQAALRGHGMELRFTADSRIMEYASTSETRGQARGASSAMRIFLGDPAVIEGAGLRMSRIDFETLLRPLLFPGSLPKARPVRTVAIDAGHGGRDPGTRNEALWLEEKHLALAVAHLLRNSLEAEGFRVVMTREGDRFVDLTHRPEIANRAGADLFISIHFNAVGNPAIEGIETYILTPANQRSTAQDTTGVADAAIHPGNRHDPWNAVFGFVVQRQLLHDLGSFDRGLKRARFQVLRGADCPAILVEGGYLSNPAEARRIAGREYQNQLVESLTLAIMHFRDIVERRQ